MQNYRRTKSGGIEKNGKRRTKPVKDSENKSSAKTNSIKSTVSPLVRSDIFGGRKEITSITGVYGESKKDIYDIEEKQLFTLSYDLRMLLESMELKKDETQ